MTYNVENFSKMFDQIQMPGRSQNQEELFRDQEDLYEVARVINLPAACPDILCIQECCWQEMLDYFNASYLPQSGYNIVRAFKGNEASMSLGLLVKKGFEILEIRDEYYLEPDPETPDKPLFSRGPVFVKLRTPGGNLLWIGTTHTKSKTGNNEAMTRWRIRELERTRAICGEILADKTTDKLMVLGDFNDDFGLDEQEQKVGTDALAVMLAGQGQDKLECLTYELRQRQPELASYHCEIKPKTYRAFIDHVFISPALHDAVRSVTLIDEAIAAVASDHYPVIAVLELSLNSQ